jgi:hypothetical protein
MLVRMCRAKRYLCMYVCVCMCDHMCMRIVDESFEELSYVSSHVQGQRVLLCMYVCVCVSVIICACV